MTLKMFGTYIDEEINRKFREEAWKRYGKDLRTPLEEALANWAECQDDIEMQEIFSGSRKRALGEIRGHTRI